MKIVDPLQTLRDHQAGICAGCERDDKELVVDHDHKTGLVRGLLCNSCNIAEGRGGRPWIQAYRDSPPAAEIGLSVRYGEHKCKPDKPDCGQSFGEAVAELNAIIRTALAAVEMGALSAETAFEYFSDRKKWPVLVAIVEQDHLDIGA